MFAITFDLEISSLKKYYGSETCFTNAYYDIKRTLREFAFFNVQGSVYITENQDMSNLMQAILKLKSMEWFRLSVRDIRAFRIEDWSDFTSFFQK